LLTKSLTTSQASIIEHVQKPFKFCTPLTIIMTAVLGALLWSVLDNCFFMEVSL
jgi:hypothetical protein